MIETYGNTTCTYVPDWITNKLGAIDLDTYKTRINDPKKLNLLSICNNGCNKTLTHIANSDGTYRNSSTIINCKRSIWGGGSFVHFNQYTKKCFHYNK